MRAETVFESLPARSERGFEIAAPPAAGSPPPPFVVLDGFAFDDATMPTRHVPIVERLARLIAASRVSSQPIEFVTIIGDADTTGTGVYNLDLARRRAESVGTALQGAILALGTEVPAGRLVVLPMSRGETTPVASNRTAAGRARNRRVNVFVPSTCQAFFAQYDLRFLPDTPVFGIPAHPNLDAATRLQRSADVEALRVALGRRLLQRARDALVGRSPSFAPIAAGSLRDAAVRLSAAQLALFREFFPAPGGAIDHPAMNACFEQFANGELRSPLASDRAAGVGEPNGAAYFLFAEFAFLCVESGIDAGDWLPALRSFVATQEIFMHVYRPGPKAPPAVGAAVPRCGSRGARRRPRSLNAFRNDRFTATGPSPTVGLGQSDSARIRALRASYAGAGLATLRQRARQNLQRAQCMP